MCPCLFWRCRTGINDVVFFTIVRIPKAPMTSEDWKRSFSSRMTSFAPPPPFALLLRTTGMQRKQAFPGRFGRSNISHSQSVMRSVGQPFEWLFPAAKQIPQGGQRGVRLFRHAYSGREMLRVKQSVRYHMF